MNRMRAEEISSWKHPAEMLSLLKKPLLNIINGMVNYSLCYRKHLSNYIQFDLFYRVN